MVAVLFIDGFDKYGPAGLTNGTLLQTLLRQEWTTADGNSLVVSGLSDLGQAINIRFNTISKTLATSYSRLIGGFRFASDLASSNAGITFTKAGASQVAVTINGSNTGTISIRTGGTGSTAIQTTLSSVNAGATHYLEWDIAIGNSAAYQVYLDGNQILDGTGDTDAWNLGSVDGIALSGGNSFIIDDLYVFDDSGSTNNAMLLTSPRVETTIPISDVQAEFAVGAGVLGATGAYQGTASSSSPGSNALFLRKYTPQVNCTLTSIACLPYGFFSTNAFVKYKAVVYADSGNSPHNQSLLATGNEVVGTLAGSTLASILTSPLSLTAGTPYWLGFITDTSIGLAIVDAGASGVVASNTYASGAPATCPTVSTAQANWLLYGNVTGVGVNWLEQVNNPMIGDLSYVSSATVNNEDLYSFNSLSVTPLNIYTVCAKALARKTDTGSRTLDVRLKSGGTDTAGSQSDIVPGTSYNWEDSFFDVDPATGLAWTASGLNAAASGIKVAS